MNSILCWLNENGGIIVVGLTLLGLIIWSFYAEPPDPNDDDIIL